MNNVRHVEIYLSEDEYKILLGKKGTKSWKAFILELSAKDDKKLYMTQKVSELFSYLNAESGLDTEIVLTLKQLTISYLNNDYAGAYIYLEKLKELTSKKAQDKNTIDQDKEINDIVKSELEG